MYTVDLYNNTGYNVENIPDSAALLGTPSISKTAVDTIQNYVMSSVRISAVFDDVKNADYCKIGDFYYFISGVTMTSRDVAVISLIPDYITSYGLTNLKFLDGITVRHHVDDDSYGLYTEDDPLLYCNEPLQLTVGDVLFDNNSQKHSYVLATVDLQEAGGGQSFNSVTYTDPGGNEVTVPHLPQLKPAQKTDFEIPAYNGNRDFSIQGVVAFPLYDISLSQPNTQILSGMQYCRDIAAETAIIDCYQIPNAYVNSDTLSADGNVSKILTNSNVLNCGIPYRDANMTPRNLRVLYGRYNKFGIMTMAGNKMEALPEEIYYANAGYTLQPRILCVADPRPDGKPYFRFEYMNKETPLKSETGNTAVIDLADFWRNTIPGQPWYHVPLVYTSPSGIIQQQKYYDQSYKMNEYTFGQRDMVNAGQMFGAASNVVLGTATQGLMTPGRNIMTTVDGESFGSPIRSPLNAVGNQQFMSGARSQISGAQGLVGSIANKHLTEAEYYNTRGRMDYEMGLLKNVVIPDVMFPYTNGTIRDFVGNGVIAYKYRPSDKDMELQDKLLTMYGYQVTDKLERKYFYNRQYFNYVKAANISIGNNLPQWWKAGIVGQLAAGVRVWHVTPNETHYDNNPIVVNP